MEYQKIEYGEEIVLTYCPSRQVQEVQLRYERDLPERMRLAAEADDSAAPDAADETPKGRRKWKWTSAVAILLCFAVSLSCVGSGIWWIADTVLDLFPAIGMPSGNAGNNQDSTDSTDGADKNAPNRQPDRDDGDNRTEDSTPRNTGKPKIEVFRPGEDAPVLQLVSAAGKQPLTAGEIYARVAPSTVTIIGEYGDTYSVGTGIIFTSDGYVMTNYHVIAGCLGCEVWITNEYGVDSVYPARFVGGDDEKDLAVLKIEAQGLPAAELGVSAELSVGDKVYAIGNPLGTELRSTFTDGIVSAVDRNVEVDGITMTLIQTNAALNQGNSGGPLVNAYGQVVGINTIKMMSGYDTIEGLGFAIPTSLAERWLNDILTLGEVRPSPILGISVNRIPVTLPDGTVGLEVLEVVKGLGAFRAGVQVGDVVVGFNGAKVTRVEDIYAQRIKLSVGDQVILRIYRDGKYLDLTMTMMAQAES